MCPPEDDGPVTNPPVPYCPRCQTHHFPAAPCPADGGGKDPGDNG